MESELSNIDRMVNQESVRSELRQIMDERRLSAIGLTNYIRLSQTTLYNFLSGKNISHKAIMRLMNDMDKLKEISF